MGAQVWRLYGFDMNGRELVLSGLKLLGSPDVVDVSAGCSIAASHVPAAGDLAHLTDGDAATVCAWRAEDVSSPGFWIEVTLAAAADVWCAQFTLPDVAVPRVEFYGLQAVTVPEAPVRYRLEVSYTGNVSDAELVKPTGAPAGMSWNVTTAVMGVASASVRPACAISGDGRYLLQSNADRLYRSEDYGFSWVQCAGVIPGSLGFLGCAISADGRVQLASGGGSGGKLCISRDYGVTWAEVPGLVYGSGGGCEKCAISADGLVMCASPTGSASGRVLVSTDGGYTWAFPVPAGAGRSYNYCSVSANGGVIAFLTNEGSGNKDLYCSYDAGVTWVYEGSANGASSRGVALNHDGSIKYFAASYVLKRKTSAGEVSLSLGHDVLCVSCDASGRSVLALSSSFVSLSSDSGASWRTENTGLSYAGFAAMAAGGGIFHLCTIWLRQQRLLRISRRRRRDCCGTYIG